MALFYLKYFINIVREMLNGVYKKHKDFYEIANGKSRCK